MAAATWSASGSGRLKLATGLADEIVHHAAVPLDDGHHGCEVVFRIFATSAGTMRFDRPVKPSMSVNIRVVSAVVSAAARRAGLMEDGRGDALAHVLPNVSRRYSR